MPPPTKSDQIHAALKTALKQVEELMGEAFNNPPHLTVIEDAKFWALAELRGSEFHIRISTGVVDAISNLWADALQRGVLQSGDELIAKDKAALVHVSLVWLLLHEMEHLSLGHFAFTGKMYLTETDRAHDFALVSRAPVSHAAPVNNLKDEVQNLVAPCFEMQADHDAIEMILDAYSKNTWEELRIRAACISVVMVLIEREDKNNGIEHSSHPKAATRIFQLLGHISEMWSLPAQAKAIQLGLDAVRLEDLPPKEEQTAFNRQVIIPAFLDAVELAQVSGADSIRGDLGDPAEFFQDVMIAKVQDAATFKNLKTAGAKEWAELVEVNTEIMLALGHDGLG